MEHGASVAETPAAVVKKCKYTIAMLSDPSAALLVGIFHFGILTCHLLDFYLSKCKIPRWFLAKMAFLSRFVPEKVTSTCLQLMLILLQRLMRFELLTHAPRLF